MLFLKPANFADADAEYAFMSALPADENGFTNPWHGTPREEFEQIALRDMIAWSKGELLPPGYVPETFYFLWDDDRIVGQFRLRHHLCDALREGAGHVGYAIAADCRGRGYGTAGLRLLLREARAIVPEEEIYLRVNRNNPASLRVMLKCGGAIHHQGEEKTYVRITNMKNTLDAILSRRSYRGKYLPAPVPREHLTQIMQAGYAAPSGCNKQTTSFIAVDDPALLAKLHAVIDPPIGTIAPAMICVLTRRIIAYRDRCYSVQDYSAAIENMLLAIEALGYASCWIEGHITDEDRIGRKMADILGVPQDMDMVCFLPVGVAAELVKGPVKKPFEQRAFFNGYFGE